MFDSAPSHETSTGGQDGSGSPELNARGTAAAAAANAANPAAAFKSADLTGPRHIATVSERWPGPRDTVPGPASGIRTCKTIATPPRSLPQMAIYDSPEGESTLHSLKVGPMITRVDDKGHDLVVILAELA